MYGQSLDQGEVMELLNNMGNINKKQLILEGYLYATDPRLFLCSLT